MHLLHTGRDIWNSMDAHNARRKTYYLFGLISEVNSKSLSSTHTLIAYIRSNYSSFSSWLSCFEFPSMRCNLVSVCLYLIFIYEYHILHIEMLTYSGGQTLKTYTLSIYLWTLISTLLDIMQLGIYLSVGQKKHDFAYTFHSRVFYCQRSIED